MNRKQSKAGARSGTKSPTTKSPRSKSPKRSPGKKDARKNGGGSTSFITQEDPQKLGSGLEYIPEDSYENNQLVK